LAHPCNKQANHDLSDGSSASANTPARARAGPIDRSNDGSKRALGSTDTFLTACEVRVDRNAGYDVTSATYNCVCWPALMLK
jgi:hypothetical protein